MLRFLGRILMRGLFGSYTPVTQGGLETARASDGGDAVDIMMQFDDGRWRLARTVQYLNDQYVIAEARSVQQSTGMRVKMVSHRNGLIDILD